MIRALVHSGVSFFNGNLGELLGWKKHCSSLSYSSDRLLPERGLHRAIIDFAKYRCCNSNAITYHFHLIYGMWAFIGYQKHIMSVGLQCYRLFDWTHEHFAHRLVLLSLGFAYLLCDHPGYLILTTPSTFLEGSLFEDSRQHFCTVLASLVFFSTIIHSLYLGCRLNCCQYQPRIIFQLHTLQCGCHHVCKRCQVDSLRKRRFHLHQQDNANKRKRAFPF